MNFKTLPPGQTWSEDLWRRPADILVRITGPVKVLDAHTLLYSDGTEVDLNGSMDAPELGQKGVTGDKVYR